MIISEMAAYYKKQGKTLLDKLDELYVEHGYYLEKLISIVLEGIEGSQRIGRIMEDFRSNPTENIDNMKLIKTIDYLNDDTGNPKSTEPKINIYIYSKDSDKVKSENKIKAIENAAMEKIQSVK